MDLWKYFAIGHKDHVFCNPLSEGKFDELIELLALPPGGRVLDIACGKAEFLSRLARRYDCSGVGIDISPYFVSEGRARCEAAGCGASVEIVEANASDYDVPPGSFDAACCIGASWVWDGFDGTLRALARATKPDGLVLVGEPFWRREPTPAYLEAARLTADGFRSHAGNVQAGLDQGLGFLHAIASNEDDWDRYEGLQCNAVERYAQDNPSDPDVPELLSWVHGARDSYLQWGRDELGWAVYVFSKAPHSGESGVA